MTININKLISLYREGNALLTLLDFPKKKWWYFKENKKRATKAKLIFEKANQDWLYKVIDELEKYPACVWLFKYTLIQLRSPTPHLDFLKKLIEENKYANTLT